MQPVPVRYRLDQLGIVASSLCAVHCALGVVLLGVSGVASALMENERLELALLLSASTAALLAGAGGYRQHRDPRVGLLIGGGLLLLGLGAVVAASHVVDAALSVAAATILITGHALNARLLHRLRLCCPPGTCTTARAQPSRGAATRKANILSRRRGECR
jgi:hypothetical protein